MSKTRKLWAYDEIQTLIRLVKKHPSLYDRKDTSYNQNQTKEEIWKKISQSPEIIEKHPYECKKKWKTLRIQQRRIIIQKIKRKDNDSAVHWPCYDALKFLIPHMDWTTTEEKSIKLEVDSDQNLPDDDAADIDDNETNNTDENSSFSNINPDEAAIEAAHDIKEVQDSRPTLTMEKPPNLNQFVFTYVPSAVPTTSHLATQEQYQNYTDEASCSHQPMKSNMSRNSSVCSSVQPQELITSTHKETSMAQHAVAGQAVITNDHKISSASVSPALNYFLMDVALQMEKLNEFAQMEVKIDIHKLLLDKLRNASNLRHSS